MDISNIRRVLQHMSLPYFRSVGYQLCSNPVTNNMVFSQEEVYVLDNLFLYGQSMFPLQSVYINSQNSRIWHAKNPRKLY
jgi:hypothetical protein